MKRLKALKAMLDSMGLEGDINTLGQRKLLQKAVYLGQRLGVDLGYRYNWYVYGPYSPSLSRDYYELATHDGELEAARVRPDAAERLVKVAGLLDVPEGVLADIDDVVLRKAGWAELLASTDFLLKVSRFDKERARETIRKEKPQLLNDFDTAVEVLESAGLGA